MRKILNLNATLFSVFNRIETVSKVTERQAYIYGGVSRSWQIGQMTSMPWAPNVLDAPLQAQRKRLTGIGI